MRLAGRSVLTASAAVAAVTCVALAQGTCETNLAGRVHLPSFQPWSPGNTPHPLVFQIGGALWRVIVAHNPTDSSNGVLWFVPDSQYLAPVISEFNQAATGDTASRLRAARALVDVMRGERGGWTYEEASLAAGLYQLWDLPPGPAEDLLADPSQYFFARSQAIRALQSYWRDPTFAAAALLGFCGLVDRARGLTWRRQSESAGVLFNDEEVEFLLNVLLSMGEYARAAGADIVRPQDLVPVDSPLRSYVANLGMWPPW